MAQLTLKRIKIIINLNTFFRLQRRFLNTVYKHSFFLFFYIIYLRQSGSYCNHRSKDNLIIHLQRSFLLQLKESFFSPEMKWKTKFLSRLRWETEDLLSKRTTHSEYIANKNIPSYLITWI